MENIGRIGELPFNFQNRIVHKDFRDLENLCDDDGDETTTSLAPSAKDNGIDWDLPIDQLRFQFQNLQNATKQHREKQFDLNFAKHKRRYEAEILRCNLYDEWGFESDKRRSTEEKEGTVKAEEIRIQKANEENLAEKRARQNSEAAQWHGTHEETQYILQMMRRAGVVDGVNSPPAKPVELPLDESTAKRVLIRCVSKLIGLEKYTTHEDSKDTAVGKGFKLNINLRNCHEVIEIQGHQIGAQGARLLSSNLLNGSCPNLMRLFLGWNNIQVLGLKELMKAVASKQMVSSITCLDLKANSISSKGLQCFQDAMDQGALPVLENLDLSKNPIQSDGARIIVHVILGGRFECLSVLKMDSCQINDAGIQALFACCSAPKFTSCLMPKAHFLSAKNNVPSCRLLRMCKPWPRVLKV